MAEFDFEQIKLILNPIGNSFSNIIKWIIMQLAELGINITDTGSKIMSLIFLSLGLFIFIKFVQMTQKPLKYLIIISLILLILSVIFSF